MPTLAFHTQAPALGPVTDPVMKGFRDRAEAAFVSAFNTQGYLGRIREDENVEFFPGPDFDGVIPEPGSFGTGEDSRAGFYADFEYAPSTLSFWSSLESVAAFAYRGVHAEALSNRQEWFAKTEYPVYVAWWIDDDDKLPPWGEAGKRLMHLHEHGPSPHAFNFKSAFDATGTPAKLDRSSLDDYAKSVH